MTASPAPLDEFVRYGAADGVAVLTYDRVAKRNAIDMAMYRAMTAGVERANADPNVGAIVITHAGPVFCAGIDIKSAPEPRDPQTGVRPSVATVGMADNTSWSHLLMRSKPTVAALNGAAIGLGATHILAADVRIGSVLASFSFPFLERGTMPEFAGTALLPRIVGFGAAMDMLLTSARLDAQESLAKGLLSRVVATEALLPTALEIARKLAKVPELPMRLTRQLVHDNAVEPDLNKVLTRERDAFVTLFRQARAAAAKTTEN